PHPSFPTRRSSDLVLAAGNPFRDVAPLFDDDGAITPAMEDERRDRDRRKHESNVDLAIHPSKGGGRARAGREPLEPGKPVRVALVAGLARGKVLEREDDPAPLFLPALGLGFALGRRKAPRIAGLLHAAREGPVRDERRRPLRKL